MTAQRRGTQTPGRAPCLVAVAFTTLVTGLPNDLHDTNKMKIATGAWWTFLSDADLEVQRELEIDECTDPHHAATVPNTLVLAPGLVIDKGCCGYWFWGRPSVSQLWRDLQDLFLRTKANFDPTKPQARTSWQAARGRVEILRARAKSVNRPESAADLPIVPDRHRNAAVRHGWLRVAYRWHEMTKSEGVDRVRGRSMPVTGPPVGRRLFLGLVALGAGAVVTGGPISRALSNVQSTVAAKDPTGLSGLIPGGGWRYYTVTNDYPGVDHATYRLTVQGAVDTPLTLSLGDITDLPRTSLVRDFQCVTGWRVTKVHWSGVLLSDLLAAAGVHPSAGAVQFRSFDGVYTECLTMAQAMRPDVLVADTMQGGPVTRNHGGPVRMLVAPMYGYKSCKWLSSIRVVPRVIPGYWEHFGYDQDGWVGRSNGRNDAPI